MFYQTDYTGFSSDPDLQVGNFLVFHCNVAGMTADQYNISVKITNPVNLDADGIFVGRIADKNLQTITVVASAAGYETVTKVYDLSGLTCDAS